MPPPANEFDALSAEFVALVERSKVLAMLISACDQCRHDAGDISMDVAVGMAKRLQERAPQEFFALSAAFFDAVARLVEDGHHQQFKVEIITEAAPSVQ